MGNVRLLGGYTGAPGNQGGGTFVPLQHFSMDSFTPGTSISVPGGYGGAQFYTNYSAPYGAATSTTGPVRSGKSSSLQITIESGETGDSGPGLPGYIVAPPSSLGQYYATSGQWFYMGMYMYLPSGFDVVTSIQDNALKMFLYTYPAVTTEKFDVHMSPTGYCFISEFDPNATQNNNYPSQRAGTNTNWPTNTWFWVERGVYMSTDGNATKQFVWLNNTMVLGQNGTTITWQTTDGSYHTMSTGASTGSPSLPSGAVGMEFADFMGFWNGGSPVTQSWYVDDIVTYTGQTGLAQDNLGNLHIPYTMF